MHHCKPCYIPTELKSMTAIFDKDNAFKGPY